MTRTRPSFTIKHVTVCDEIRREDSGKFILIGVYGENIIVPRFPLDMTLAFFMSIIPHKEGEISCQWKITHDKFGDLTVTEGKMLVKQKEKESLVALRRVPLQVPEDGILSLKVRENEGRWRNVKSMLITHSSEDS